MFAAKRHHRFLIHLVGHYFLMNDQQKYFTKVHFENEGDVQIGRKKQWFIDVTVNGIKISIHRQKKYNKLLIFKPIRF